MVGTPEPDQELGEVRHSSSPRLKLLFFWFPCAVFLLILVCPFLQKVCWVGRADLEVEFTVTDAVTGQPVSDAQIEIHSEGGLYKERDRREFQLTTDPNGRVSYICLDSMSSGSRGPFEYTYSVQLPWWRFRTSAAGFQSNDWVELNVPEFGRRVRRAGPGKAKVEIPIRLSRE